jgi:hypothetical protein
MSGLHEAHVRQAPGQFLDEDPHFQPGDVLAHALVAAIAEGQVLGRAVAVDVEEVAILEMPGIMVGRGADDQQLGFGGNRHTGDLGVARRLSGARQQPSLRAAGIPRSRSGSAPDRLADPLPDQPVAMAEQQLERIGEASDVVSCPATMIAIIME